MSFFLSPSGWIFPLRRGSSSSLLILPGLLRSDRGGLSVSSPSGEREDACGLRRWRKFPALEFYSASFLHWISSLSYPYFTTLYILNKRLIKQLFPDPRQRRPRFEFPGSAGAGPRQASKTKCFKSSFSHVQFQVPRRRHLFCSGKPMDWLTLGQVATSNLTDCDKYEVGVTPFLAYTQIL